MGTGAEAASLNLPSRPFTSSGKETHERSLVGCCESHQFHQNEDFESSIFFQKFLSRNESTHQRKSLSVQKLETRGWARTYILLYWKTTGKVIVRRMWPSSLFIR